MMAISSGTSTLTLSSILKRTTEWDIVNYYLGINKIPCLICSPLRKDSKPSFGLFTKDGKSIRFRDFATNEKGNLYTLLSLLWDTDFKGVLQRLDEDLINNKFNNLLKIENKKFSALKSSRISISKSQIQIHIKKRKWLQYDIDYWNSYGISLKWLNWCEVYPISHKIIDKDNERYIFKADKYAYAYVEHKDNITTYKIYQPFNTNGYKWSNNHNSSILSLWTKVPYTASLIVICSSVKDALCLSANTNIPAIAVQGEGYTISKSAIKSLKERYNKIYILFDNDEAGLKDGISLSESTGFTNVVLPTFEGGKDVSDLYKQLSNKEKFKKIINNLLNIESNGKKN